MIETWWQLLKAVELAVLALAPWPFYRALAIPSFKRFYLCFAVSVGVILVTYAVTIIVIALVLPALLHLIAMLALAVLLLERLRARESYGQGRKLPPGSLALVPRTPWVDHRFYLKRAAQHGPVFKTSLFFRPMVCVIGADLGYALLQEHGDALRAPPVRFNRFIPRGFLRYMEGEDHLRYRKLFQLGIAPAVLKSSASAIESQVREALKRIADVSAPRGDQGINPRAAIREMMLSILLRLFFGITEDNERFRRLSELYERIDVRKAACGSAKSEIRVAREIAATIKKQAGSLLNSSAEDKPATASFLAEILRRDPNTAEDDCVLLNLVYMVQVARGDMTGLLMWVLKKMSDNHEIVDELRDISSNPSEASQSAASELSAAIVKETLRLDQSEFLYRKAQDEIRFKGFVIPKGWLVRICIREGHRDPELFSDPERFDPHRFLENEYGAKAYCPLGLLGHSCLGAMLVDRIGRTFVRVLATEFDWSVLSDGPREFGAAHWTTSASLRIGLRRRQPLSEVPSARWV